MPDSANKSTLKSNCVYGNVLSFAPPLLPVSDAPLSAVGEEAATPQHVLHGRQYYRTVAFVLTALTLAAAVASCVFGVFVFMIGVGDFGEEIKSADVDDLDVLAFALGVVLFVESPCAIIAMIACISYLGAKPRKLLIPPPRSHGAHVCLCISVIALCLLACGTFVFSCVVLACNSTVATGILIALLVVLLFRVGTLVGFYTVLLLQRRLE